MKKLFLLPFLFLLMPLVADASTQTFWFRTTGGVTATQMVPLNHSLTGTSVNNAKNVGVFPIPGTFKNLRVFADVAMSGTQKWTISLNFKGTNQATTCVYDVSALGVAPTVGCNDLVNQTTLASSPGTTTAAIQIAAANAPPSTTVWGTIDFAPATANETAEFGAANGNNLSTTLDSFEGFDFGSNAATPSESRVWGLFAEGGTLDNLSITAATVNPSPGTYTAALRVIAAGGGSPATSTPTCALASIIDCKDFTHAVTVAAGDSYNMSFDPSATPAATGVGWGFRFVPSTAGDYQTHSGAQAQTVAGAVRYYAIMGGAGANPTAIEASSTVYIGTNTTLRGFQVESDVVPGAGKTYTIQFRKNNADVASCSGTITGATASTTSLITCNTALVTGDNVDYSVTPSGTPTVARIHIVSIWYPTPAASTAVNNVDTFWAWLTLLFR